MIERGKRVMDKNIFEKEEKNFFKGIEGSTEYKRAVPEIDKFVKFWKGIWEKGDRTPNTIWMEKIREELNKKITSVKQLDITENGLISEIKKRKSCTTPGVDGIQNVLWKGSQSIQKALQKTFE